MCETSFCFDVMHNLSHLSTWSITWWHVWCLMNQKQYLPPFWLPMLAWLKFKSSVLLTEWYQGQPPAIWAQSNTCMFLFNPCVSLWNVCWLFYPCAQGGLSPDCSHLWFYWQRNKPPKCYQSRGIPLCLQESLEDSSLPRTPLLPTPLTHWLALGFWTCSSCTLLFK